MQEPQGAPVSAESEDPKAIVGRISADLQKLAAAAPPEAQEALLGMAEQLESLLSGSGPQAPQGRTMEQGANPNARPVGPQG